MNGGRLEPLRCGTLGRGAGADEAAEAERAKKRDDEKLAEQRSLCPAGKKRVKKKEDDEIVVTY